MSFCYTCKIELPEGKKSRVCSDCRRAEYLKNKEQRLERGRIWYQQNKEKRAKSIRLWREKNKEKVRELDREWGYRHYDYRLAQNAVRRARRKLGTPAALTKDQMLWIQWMYRHAKKMTEITGVPHHVDHIHPLKGENFCGLHVPWNLQVIPAEENIKKGNRLWQDV